MATQLTLFISDILETWKADLNKDGAVTFADYSLFTRQWNLSNCTSPNWCAGVDYDHDGSVDLDDLLTFLVMSIQNRAS